MLKIFISLLFLTASLLATADGPDYFSIRNVAYNDVLWMHPKPDYHSFRIKGIPSSASCIKNMGCYKNWCKVSYGGIIGWVNGHYLAEGTCNQPYQTSKQPVSYNNKPTMKTMKVPHVSWGACMLICEDIKFCKNADHNRQTSMCILNINTNHPAYRNLYQRCASIPLDSWKVSYQNDKWMIGCPR